MSFAAVFGPPFFAGIPLPFDDVVRAGTGLSLLEAELWESARAFSPFVDDVESLLDLRFLRSLGMVVEERERSSRFAR